jgi:hypothetical protein
MTWVDEWRTHLKLQSESEPTYVRVALRDTLREFCESIGVVYRISIYNDFIRWESTRGLEYRTMDGSFTPVPLTNHLNYFMHHSEHIQGQLQSIRDIEKLEQIAKRDNLRLYTDNIMEKISLTDHYVRLRGSN